MDLSCVTISACKNVNQHAESWCPFESKGDCAKCTQGQRWNCENRRLCCGRHKKYDVAMLCKEGFLERIRRGVYQLPGNDQITEEQLLRELLPQGIVCVESALFHYGYSDFAPRAWSVAVPRTASRAVGNIGEFPVRAYYIQKEYFPIGKTIESFNGVMLPVYDRERTVCDCFKYRTKLDNETFNKALNALLL